MPPIVHGMTALFRGRRALSKSAVAAVLLPGALRYPVVLRSAAIASSFISVYAECVTDGLRRMLFS